MLGGYNSFLFWGTVMCLPIEMRYHGRCTPFKGPVSAHLHVHPSACIFTELARLYKHWLRSVATSYIQRGSLIGKLCSSQSFGTNAAISRYFYQRG